MVKTIEAIFDGEVFRPEEPLELEPNTRVKLTIEFIVPDDDMAVSFLHTARNLKLDGPPDWSEKI